MHTMICGGRDHEVIRAEADWLDGLRQSLPITTYIPGGGKHIDSAIAAWAQHHGIPVAPIPTDWQPQHAHGALRRVAYLRLLQAHLPPGTLAIIGLPGGSGTAFLVQQARALGLPVSIYEEQRMPTMSVPDPEPQSPVPMLDDDIPDAVSLAAPEVPQEGPELPPGVPFPPSPVWEPTPTRQEAPTPSWREHEALLQGFLGHLLQVINREVVSESKNLLDLIKATIRVIDTSAAKQAQVNEHAQYQLSDALTKLQTQGLQVHRDPYEVTVQARSLEGFSVQIQMAKQTTAEVVSALPQLLSWLAQEGFTPCDVERVR